MARLDDRGSRLPLFPFRCWNYDASLVGCPARARGWRGLDPAADLPPRSAALRHRAPAQLVPLLPLWRRSAVHWIRLPGPRARALARAAIPWRSSAYWDRIRRCGAHQLARTKPKDRPSDRGFAGRLLARHDIAAGPRPRGDRRGGARPADGDARGVGGPG